MNNHKSFSISFQRELSKRNLAMDSEINKAIKELNFRSLLRQSGIRKRKGYGTLTILFLIVLLPFLKKSMTAYWTEENLGQSIEARKDTFYRFLNHEQYNWRRLVYLLAVKLISMNGEVQLKKKVIITDDTNIPKTGQQMELVSYHFDHKSKRSILGYQCLQLAYHDGKNFFPLDMAGHTSSKRPNTKIKSMDKRTHGWKRRKESFIKKTDVLIEMVRRASQAGIDASFLLFDSWFAFDRIIAKVLEQGYGVICRLKTGKTKYQYQGQSYTLKQLWKEVARKQARLLEGMNVKGVCLNVSLPKSGLVRILFVSDGHKKWQAFLSTDLELESHEILEYYARRWSIEVFFKDGKQLLYMGKEQSESFDALIACYSLVMIRYLLLVYITNKYNHNGPVGPLFRELAESQLKLNQTKAVWDYVKELLVLSSQLLWLDSEIDKLIDLVDIVELSILTALNNSTAKL